MPTLSYIDTLHQTLIKLMQQNDSIIAIGGWEGPTTGPTVASAMGDKRVVSPPVSEMAICGAAIGAALAGMRPFVNFGLAGFMINAWEQLVNEAAVHHYMSAGRVKLPIVFHCTVGVKGGEAAQHSFSAQAVLWNTPGLKIVLPSTCADLQGLILTAMTDANPVMILSQATLLPLRGEVADAPAAIPFGQAAVTRQGKDITLVATSRLAHHALTAAEQLSVEGVEAEVIDPRTLVPFDEATIVASVRKTGRLVVADETHLSCGVASEIAARIGYAAFHALKAPIERVATPDVPVPFSKTLEQTVVPGPAQIVDAARRALRAA
jgi:acetoin:2,6-dichlorophenolindophenol oxidoreductase subunit beta